MIAFVWEYKTLLKPLFWPVLGSEPLLSLTGVLPGLKKSLLKALKSLRSDKEGHTGLIFYHEAYCLLFIEPTVYFLLRAPQLNSSLLTHSGSVSIVFSDDTFENGNH